MQYQLSEDVRNALDYIIKSEYRNASAEIGITQGCEAGDGYGSMTRAISITGDNGKAIKLFVKYVPETINKEWVHVYAQTFQTEFKFYNAIYPAFNKFQGTRNVKETFNNVAKHYEANIGNCELPPIMLEDLRSLGYRLRDRKKPVDDDHLKLPIQAFARYHAISYAMKDQELELFQTLSSGIKDSLVEGFKKFGMFDIITKCVHQFLDSLDPICDGEILYRCENLSEVLIKHSLSIPGNADEYSVIAQGDCWSNNMMFLYDEKTGLPIDVKLIDWQAQTVNSPLPDFCYFFYTLATKNILDNADYYLNLYYDTLSQTIKDLGSKPEETYPYEIFLEHWRKFALFGLTMAFCMVKAQLFEEDEVPDLLHSAGSSTNSFSMNIKHQDVYIKRMRDLVEYFIRKKLL